MLQTLSVYLTVQACGNSVKICTCLFFLGTGLKFIFELFCDFLPRCIFFTFTWCITFFLYYIGDFLHIFSWDAYFLAGASP